MGIPYYIIALEQNGVSLGKGLMIVYVCEMGLKYLRKKGFRLFAK